MGQGRRPETETAGDDRMPEDNPAGAPKGMVKSTVLIVEDEIFIRLATTFAIAATWCLKQRQASSRSAWPF
jgi:hypothetical protein